MSKRSNWHRSLLTVVILSVLSSGLPANGQDLIPISDITGSSSVFVFRASGRSASRRATAVSHNQRSGTRKLETARKINRQYVALSKEKPARVRTTVVDPNKLPAIPTMQKEAASRMFAGVGEYYIDSGDLDNSVRFFREAVTLDSKNDKARTGLSEALALKGNDLLVNDKPENAKGYFEESLKSNPNNAASYFGLGEVLSELDQAPAAIASYEKALSLNSGLTEIYVPLGILYFQKGEIAKADSFLSKALAAAPDNSETQYFLGLVRYSQNRNEEALNAFRKAASIDPNYAEAFFYTGETLSRLGRAREAVSEYRKALALKQNYLEALLRLGEAYYDTESYTEAVNTYKEAVKLKNDNIEAYTGLADSYRMLSNFIDAEANYNLATVFIGRNKDFDSEEAAEVYSKHGYVIGRQCEINTQKGLLCKWGTAIKSLESAVALTHNPIDYANLGWAYYKAGRVDIDLNKAAEGKAKLEQARTNLQKALDMKPAFIEAPLINLGMTLSDLGEYQAATDVLARAVEKKPDWVFALNELGRAFYLMKDYKNASKNFRRAIDKDGKYVWAYYNLAQTEFDAGNKGEAKKAYDKVKQLSPQLALRLMAVTKGQIGR